MNLMERSGSNYSLQFMRKLVREKMKLWLNMKDITKQKVSTSLMFLIFVIFSNFGSSEMSDMN